jgi:hypothetical protein
VEHFVPALFSFAAFLFPFAALLGFRDGSKDLRTTANLLRDTDIGKGGSRI